MIDPHELEAQFRMSTRPPANGDARDEPESHYTPWPPGLDLEDLGKRDPEPPKFIIDDWLPTGYATLLAGHGGAGKSGIGLQGAVCMASPGPVPFAGLRVNERKRVTYLSCEDRESVLHWRLSRICQHFEVSLADLAGWLEIVDLVGHDAMLWSRNTRGNMTPAMVSLAERIRECRSEVIIVDGVTDTFAGNEIDRSEVKAYVNQLLGFVHPDRGALLLLAHVNRVSAANGGGAEGYSGSTAWHNAVRARWYLYPEKRQSEPGEEAEKTGELLLELQKSNHGQSDQAVRFRWDPDAHLFEGAPVASRSPQAKEEQASVERHAIMAAVRAVVADGDYVPAAMQGPRTAFNVLRARPEFPTSIANTATGRRRFWAHIEQLRRIRYVREGEIRRADRKTTVTLEPVS